MGSFLIRSLDAKDAAGLAALDAVCNAPGWTEAMFLRELELPQSWARVALRGEDVVGFVVAWFVDGQVQVHQLGVRPALRRQGVASLLIRDLLAAARAGGAQRLDLELRKNNVAALRLYQKFGFVVVGERKNFYQPFPGSQDPEGCHAILMSLSLGKKHGS